MRLSVNKPNKNSTLPAKKEGLINLIPVENIVSMPETDAKGILCISDFILLNNNNIQVLYLTPNTQKYSINSDGEADSRLFKKKVFGNYPGNELQIFEFIKENINQGFVAVYKECGGNVKIFGSKSNPLFLNPNYNEDKDKKSYEVNLEQNNSDDVPILFYVYDGEPSGTFLLDAIGSSSLQGLPLGFIYLKTAEPTAEELAKFDFPVGFRIINSTTGKFTEILYDKYGNKFSEESGSPAEIINEPSYSNFLRPGDVTKIYKADDTDQLYVWDVEINDYKKSSIDEARIVTIEKSITNEIDRATLAESDLYQGIDAINAEFNAVANQRLHYWDLYLGKWLSSGVQYISDGILKLKVICFQNYTITQRDAITSPQEGMLIYVSDEPKGFQKYESGAWKSAGGDGKNLANSKLVSILNAGLDFGANWQIDTQGFFFKLLGLADKSADTTYDRLLGVDVNGNIAKVNGMSSFVAGFATWTDAQKDAYRIAQRKTNEFYSIGQARIDIVAPAILDKTQDRIQYVTLIGINLFLNNNVPNNATIEMTNINTNEVFIVTNFTSYQINPDKVTFGLNFSVGYTNGNYSFRVFHNGIWSLPSLAILRVRSAFNELLLPALTWQVENIDGTDNASYIDTSRNSLTIRTNDAPNPNSKQYGLSSEIVSSQEVIDGVFLKFAIFFQMGAFSEMNFGLSNQVLVKNTLSDAGFKYNENGHVVYNSGKNYYLTLPPFNYTSLCEDILYVIIENGTVSFSLEKYGAPSVEILQTLDAFKLKIVGQYNNSQNYGYYGMGAGAKITLLKKYSLV